MAASGSKTWFQTLNRPMAFHDMYSGVFSHLEHWRNIGGYFSRLIYINRYVMPQSVYQGTAAYVWGKDYFVLTIM